MDNFFFQNESYKNIIRRFENILRISAVLVLVVPRLFEQTFKPSLFHLS